MAPKKAAEKKAAKASEAGSDGAATAARGKEVEVDGLPPGWIGLEKVYATGGYAGKTYVRFCHESGRHPSICSVKKVIEIDAQEKGLDPAAALAEYEERKKTTALKRKAEVAAKREERGHLEGQKKKQCIEAFRAKYNKLDGATVMALPGWRGESKYLEKCGQICARYYSPEGTVFALINDIEAMFGLRMGNGQELPDIEAARSAVTDTTGKRVNAARIGESVKTEFSAEAVKTKKKKKKKVRVAQAEEYRASKHLQMVPLLRATTADEMELHGVADHEEIMTSAQEIQRLLADKGFPDDTPLLYMTPAKSARTPSVRLINAVSGIYFPQPELFNDRPYYQKVFLAGPDNGMLACSGHYISWSAFLSCWKIGKLDEGAAGMVVCRQDVPVVFDVSEPWMLYEPKFGAGDEDDGEAEEEQEDEKEPDASS